MPTPVANHITRSRVAVAILRPLNDDQPPQSHAGDEDFRDRFAVTPDVWIEGAVPALKGFRRYTRRDRVFDGCIYVDNMIRNWRFVHTLTQAEADRLAFHLDEYGDCGCYVLTTRVQPGVRLRDTLWLVEVR